TTKRGGKGKGTIANRGYARIGTEPKKLKVLNSEEFLQTEMNSYNNVNHYDATLWENGTYEHSQNERKNSTLYDEDTNLSYATDWQKDAMRKAFSQNHSLSFTGGKDEQSYGIFLIYANQEGLIKTPDLKRYSARFVIDDQIKDWLKIGGGFTFNHVE